MYSQSVIDAMSDWQLNDAITYCIRTKGHVGDSLRQLRQAYRKRHPEAPVRTPPQSSVRSGYYSLTSLAAMTDTHLTNAIIYWERKLNGYSASHRTMEFCNATLAELVGERAKREELRCLHSVVVCQHCTYSCNSCATPMMVTPTRPLPICEGCCHVH